MSEKTGQTCPVEDCGAPRSAGEGYECSCSLDARMAAVRRLAAEAGRGAGTRQRRCKR